MNGITNNQGVISIYRSWFKMYIIIDFVVFLGSMETIRFKPKTSCILDSWYHGFKLQTASHDAAAILRLEQCLQPHQAVIGTNRKLHPNTATGEQELFFYLSFSLHHWLSVLKDLRYFEVVESWYIYIYIIMRFYRENRRYLNYIR